MGPTTIQIVGGGEGGSDRFIPVRVHFLVGFSGSAYFEVCACPFIRLSSKGIRDRARRLGALFILEISSSFLFLKFPISSRKMPVVVL